jgi:fatty-acyl-CoA synthase
MVKAGDDTFVYGCDNSKLAANTSLKVDAMSPLPNVGEVLRFYAYILPDKIGARDLERAMTFREWNGRSCRLANALLGMGLAKGDRIAVLAYNCIEWLEIYAATAKAGLIVVPINFRLLSEEVCYIVEDAAATALIVQHDLLQPVERARPGLSVPARNFIHFGAATCPRGYRAYGRPPCRSARQRAGY